MNLSEYAVNHRMGARTSPRSPKFPELTILRKVLPDQCGIYIPNWHDTRRGALNTRGSAAWQSTVDVLYAPRKCERFFFTAGRKDLYAPVSPTPDCIGLAQSEMGKRRGDKRPLSVMWGGLMAQTDGLNPKASTTTTTTTTMKKKKTAAAAAAAAM